MVMQGSAQVSFKDGKTCNGYHPPVKARANNLAVVSHLRRTCPAAIFLHQNSIPRYLNGKSASKATGRKILMCSEEGAGGTAASKPWFSAWGLPDGEYQTQTLANMAGIMNLLPPTCSIHARWVAIPVHGCTYYWCGTHSTCDVSQCPRDSACVLRCVRCSPHGMSTKMNHKSKNEP